MSTRIVHSCDWCGVDSNRPGCTDTGWVHVELCMNGMRVHVWLCKVCFAAYDTAVQQAYKTMRKHEQVPT